MDPEAIFYFLHIPKTAGTTFISVLHQLFDSNVVCPPYEYPDFLRIPREDLQKYVLFRGHFYYFFRSLLPTKPIYLTFLRNPIERAISLWDHIRRDKHHYQYQTASSLDGGLGDAVRSSWLIPPNFQVTALACDLDPLRLLDGAQLTSQSAASEYSVVYSKITKYMPTRVDLTNAMRRLEEMEFFGIAEQFDTSVDLLCSTFGWVRPNYEPLNVAPNRTKREQITPDVQRALLQSHELDFELYDFALSLFAKRVGRSGSVTIPVSGTIPALRTDAVSAAEESAPPVALSYTGISESAAQHQQTTQPVSIV